MVYSAAIKIYNLQKLLIICAHSQSVTSSAKVDLQMYIKYNPNYEIGSMHRKTSLEENSPTRGFLCLHSEIQQVFVVWQ